MLAGIRRALSWVSTITAPRPTRHRLPARTPRRNYQGAASSRLSADWILGPTTVDETIKNSLTKLRQRSQDLCRNNAYAVRYLDLVGTNVVGKNGIRLRSEHENIDTAWKDWGRKENCTVSGDQTLRQFLWLAWQTRAADGEVIIRMHPGFKGSRYRFAVQMIDAALLDINLNDKNPKTGNLIVMGVEENKHGRPVAYWFHSGADVRKFGVSMVSRGRLRIPAEQIIHSYRRRRPNQTRGVPDLAPIMMDAKMLDGLLEAEIVAARTAASKMGFLERKMEDVEGYSPDPENDDPTEMEAEPGAITELDPGLHFESWDPQHPSTAFPSFIKTNIRRFASGLCVSYPSLANDVENVNFSSLRHVAIEDRDHWGAEQSDLIDDLLEPMYRAWIFDAMLSGHLTLPERDPRAWFAVKWIPRGWQWVDPVKEGKAAEGDLKNNLTSNSRLLQGKGIEYEDVLEERQADRKLEERYGATAPDDGDDKKSEPNDWGGRLATAIAPNNGNGNGNGTGTN